MTTLELVGASALYIVGVVALAYAGAGITAYFLRHRDLSGLVPVILVWFGTMIAGAIVGLVLFGKALA